MISKIKKTFSLAGILKGKKREVNRTGPYYIHESPVSRIDDSTLLFFFPLSPPSVASTEPAAAPPSSRSLCFSLGNERDDTAAFFCASSFLPSRNQSKGRTEQEEGAKIGSGSGRRANCHSTFSDTTTRIQWLSVTPIPWRDIKTTAGAKIITFHNWLKYQK